MGKTPQQLVDELHRQEDKLYTYEYMEVLEDRRFKTHMKKYEEGMKGIPGLTETREDVWRRTLADRAASRRDNWAKLKNDEIL